MASILLFIGCAGIVYLTLTSRPRRERDRFEFARVRVTERGRK